MLDPQPISTLCSSFSSWNRVIPAAPLLEKRPKPISQESEYLKTIMTGSYIYGWVAFPG